MKHLYHVGDHARDHCAACPCEWFGLKYERAPSGFSVFGVCPYGEAVEYREAVPC